jgi:hypothetical protein
MGAPRISDQELEGLGIDVVQRLGPGSRGLLVPRDAVQGYKDLIREKLNPGFWSDIVGRQEISFLFKLADGRMKEFTYSPRNREEIARLCSKLNDDPIEKTSDPLRYMAGNPFYRDLMVEFHGVTEPNSGEAGPG